jgi:hypothetical protein
VILAQDRQLVEDLEAFSTLAEDLEKAGHSAKGEINIVLRSSEHYAPDRILHDCVVFRGATKPA